MEKRLTVKPSCIAPALPTQPNHIQRQPHQLGLSATFIHGLDVIRLPSLPPTLGVIWVPHPGTRCVPVGGRHDLLAARSGTPPGKTQH